MPDPFAYLFVQELASVLLDVSLVQVSGEAHQAHLREAEISQLDVAHRRDQQTEGTADTKLRDGAIRM